MSGVPSFGSGATTRSDTEGLRQDAVRASRSQTRLSLQQALEHHGSWLSAAGVHPMTRKGARESGGEHQREGDKSLEDSDARRDFTSFTSRAPARVLILRKMRRRRGRKCSIGNPKSPPRYPLRMPSGQWTKADSVTAFDDLSIKSIDAE